MRGCGCGVRWHLARARQLDEEAQCLRALRTFRGLSSAVELFRRILHTYSTYSSKEAFLEEMSQLCTNIGGAQQWLSDVMADVVGDPQQ